MKYLDHRIASDRPHTDDSVHEIGDPFHGWQHQAQGSLWMMFRLMFLSRQGSGYLNKANQTLVTEFLRSSGRRKSHKEPYILTSSRRFVEKVLRGTILALTCSVSNAEVGIVDITQTQVVSRYVPSVVRCSSLWMSRFAHRARYRFWCYRGEAEMSTTLRCREEALPMYT